MTAPLDPRKVHLTGSIGLPTAQEVFGTVGPLLGTRLHSIPDGEIGGRRSWIGWQGPVLRANPFLAPERSQRSPTNSEPLYGLAPDVEPAEVTFGELGYAHEARASYQLFLAARKAGAIAEGVRFQVSLPTPLAVAFRNFSRTCFAAIEEPYERAMLAEVDTICSFVPASDLCIQWDVCHEMLIWDRQLPNFALPIFADPEAEIIARIKRLCEHVPSGVECGVHLCYGNKGGAHFVEPQDATKMTSLANAIGHAVERSLTYIHMPVPIERDDDDYFAPFQALELDQATGIYLGLVHTDGGAQIRRRIATAQRHLPHFGIATECGISNSRIPGSVLALLEAHALTE